MTIDYAKPFIGAYWFDILPRSLACPGLAPDVLLHAGPPLRGMPAAPMLHAALQAILFEGLADDEAGAHALLASGRVRLQPAQDHGVATPLAQVVSASMLLVVVRIGGHACYAPVVEGPAPALRFGAAAPACRQRLQAFGAQVEAAVAPLLRRQPVAIDAVIRTAVALGDECHARTGAANEALVAQLEGLDADSAAALRANPAFVLTVLMAAACAALRAHRSGIAAIGGNGIEFGVRHRGAAAWRTAPAAAPLGTRIGGHDATAPLGAIGDSPVIDFCGLGGQALAIAPALAAEWAAVLPTDALVRRLRLVDPVSGIVDPAQITQHALAPLVNLAILDLAGAAGLVGRGFYSPPASLFAGQPTEMP